MDNGQVRSREMKAPDKTPGRNTFFLWPITALGILIYLLLWMILAMITQTIMSFFKEKKSVKGKLVLVTGAGRGLGRGIAVEMSKLGARIACVDINTANNEKTAQLITEQGGTARAFTCNIAKSDQIEALKKQLNAEMGTVDILINNAALVMGITISEMTYKDIRGMYEVNLMGPAFMAKAFLDDMLERNSGHIVTISSIAAVTSIPFLSLYNSTKAGVTRFFDTVRAELGIRKNNKVKITTLHPFFINTSADYTTWFQPFFPILKESYVTKSVIDAILYEKESVMVPSFLSVLGITDALFGSYLYKCAMDIFLKQIHLPSKKERDQLPYTHIVNATA